MIYLLYGKDTARARSKLKSLIDSLQAKKPDATFVRVTQESFREDRVQEFIGAQGLFESRLIIVFDCVLKNKNAESSILSALKEFSQSKNICIFFEEDLDKRTLALFKKHTEKVQSFLLQKNKKGKTTFNIFELADALGERNKKRLWVLYQRGKLSGVSDEEVHGILLWGVKSMHLAQSARNAEEGELNPFVFKKAVRFAHNYSANELNNLSTSLVTLYHDARGGICPLDIALERFILSV